MKRMVENSEKIEELASIVEITEDDLTIKSPYLLVDGGTVIQNDLNVNGPAEFYGSLMVSGKFETSNITTPSGFVLNLINENDYTISDSGLNMGIGTMNLGTAIFVTAYVSVETQNGEYTIININNAELSNYIGVLQISGEPVCTVDKVLDGSNNTVSINFTLNKNKAEYSVTDYYRFSFILGHIGKMI